LAERGLSVAVCEKGVVAGEASGRSLGWIESVLTDPHDAPLIVRAKELWPEVNARTGSDTGYRRTGVGVLCSNEQDYQAAQGWVRQVRGEPGFAPRFLNRSESEYLINSSASSWFAVLYEPGDGLAEPRWIAPAAAEGARKHGATIHQHCAVRGIETSAGRCSGVVTGRGVIKTERVVLATGAWTGVLCGSLGMSLPLMPMYATMSSVAPFTGVPRIPADHGQAGWRPEVDGGCSIGWRAAVVPVGWDTVRHGMQFAELMRKMGSFASAGVGWETLHSFSAPARWKLDEPSPFEATRILEPAPNPAFARQVFSDLQRALPAFRTTHLRETWAGVLVATPDSLPILSAVDSVPGLFVGAALDNGLSIAPSAGELMADLATGATPRVDVAPYRLSRLI
jgi:glycine/D-amino acid oxidase-like deaminating enzyme